MAGSAGNGKSGGTAAEGLSSGISKDFKKGFRHIRVIWRTELKTVD